MTNTSYALGICQICDQPMTLAEIREGVVWEEQDVYALYGYMFYSDDDETRVAHRRCWKDLAEAERKFIRKESTKDPVSMGQKV